MVIDAGSNSSDEALRVNNYAGTNLFKVRGDGNVGIGCNPSSKLEVSGSGAQYIKAANTSASTVAYIGVAGDNQTYIGSFAGANDDSKAVNIAVGTVSKLIIGTNGYLVAQSASQVRLVLGSTGSSNNNTSNWVRGNGVDLGYNAASGNHIFEVGGSEKMRIDSSGNIKINSGNLQIKTTGQIEENGSRLLLRSTGDASGLRFDGSAYTPFKNGSESNGTVDLGHSGGKYKDLYLSGGAYLGGAVAANKLDDYEEGTWTPSLTASGGASSQGYAYRVGSYTKIGNKVTANWRILLNAKGSLTGTTRISGLPFAGNASPIYNVASTMVGLIYLDDDENFKAVQYAANSFLYLMIEKDDTAISQISGNGKFDNDSEISGSLTYFTNS